jgi:hypothetical protein
VQLLVFLPLLIPALAAIAARPLAARLEPRRATWLLTVAVVALAACSTAALALLVAWAAAGAPVLAALGHYSPHVVRRGDPLPVVTGAVAALGLTGIAVAVVVTFRRRARALAESYRRAARMHPGTGVVVVGSPDIEAYALPGRPGLIVVSGGLLDALDDDGRAALLAHETAHLAGRHHLFTTVAHLAAAANPLLLPLARAVDYTVERWADEHAARVTGDRRLVAATIGRVALLVTPRTPKLAAVSFGIAGPWPRRLAAWPWTRLPGTAAPRGGRVSVAWAGPVPRRVAALLAPPLPRRTLLLAAAAAIVMIAGVSALEAARDLHALLELARAAR